MALAFIILLDIVAIGNLVMLFFFFNKVKKQELLLDNFRRQNELIIEELVSRSQMALKQAKAPKAYRRTPEQKAVASAQAKARWAKKKELAAQTQAPLQGGS